MTDRSPKDAAVLMADASAASRQQALIHSGELQLTVVGLTAGGANSQCDCRCEHQPF
jgi:hypothetical protein